MNYSDQPGSVPAHAKGFLLAVIGTSLLTALGSVIMFWSQGDGAGALFIFPFALLIAAPVILFSALFIGLPLTWALSTAGWERSWVYPLAGLVLGGLLVSVLPALMAEHRASAAEFVRFAWVGAVPGGICGWIWWSTYRRHRQDLGENRG